MADSTAVQVLATEPLREAGIVAMLDTAPGLSVRKFSLDEPVDIIVADLSALVEETVQQLVSSNQKHRSVAVVITDSPEIDANAVTAAGVVRILHSAEATHSVVLAAIKHAAAADCAAQPASRAGLVAQIQRIREITADKERRPALSEREIAILSHLAEGGDTRGIARSMNISERTFKYLLWCVMNRHSLRNRAHAVAFGIRAGVV
jgi:DNA-binding NarL/FixJ family response regulator